MDAQQVDPHLCTRPQEDILMKKILAEWRAT
jgi:hypothetical protein